MKPLPAVDPLLAVARRVVWFKEPAAALADPVRFLAHVMTWGTAEDLAAVAPWVTKADYCRVLDAAPPGIFDRRSWAYWNLVCGRFPAPPLPTRRLPPLEPRPPASAAS